MGDEGIKVDSARHSILNHARKLCTPTYATEGTSTPHATRYQLEWTRRDFLPCTSHADNNALAPSFVTAFKSRAHHVDITNTFKTEINPTISHLNNYFLNRPCVGLGIYALCGSH